MARQDSNSSAQGRQNCKDTKELDLRGFARYAASVDWVRRNVVLDKTLAGEVLQLDILLPDGLATLYMNLANHYVMAFRGADKIYLLNDPAAEQFKKALRSQLKDADFEMLEGLGSGHGFRGLRTFTGEGEGKEAWKFQLEDLSCASALSSFSAATPSYEPLRKSLSLLVCMICESARIPMMEFGFTYRFYFNWPVSPDRAINSYKHAKDLIVLARELFPGDPLSWAIERLPKRAAELDSLLSRINSRIQVRNQKKC